MVWRLVVLQLVLVVLVVLVATGRGLTFRIEARFDHSNEAVFPGRDRDRASQITLAGNAVYAA